jgi:hypothetical protein
LPFSALVKLWEVAMSASKRPRVFIPLDLEIIDRVYEAAWAKIEADNLFREVSRDDERKQSLRKRIFALDERKQSLRKRIFALAGSGPVDFDTLYEKVMRSAPQPLAKAPGKKPRGSPPQVGA